MAFQLRQTQKLTQKLALTPQMRQAIRILQMPIAELNQYLREQTIENPLLEVAGDAEPEISSDQPSTDHAMEAEARPEPEALSPEQEFVEYFEEYMQDDPSRNQKLVDNDQALEMYNFRESLLTDAPNFRNSLFEQFRMLSPRAGLFEVGEYLVGNLDENGYLRTTVEEAAESCACSLEESAEALAMLQSLDPPGIAARDLAECLMLQLARQGREDTLAYRLVRDYLKELGVHHLKRLAKELKVPLSKIVEATAIISQLDPKPALALGLDDNHPVVPDISIVKEEGGFVVVLKDEELLPLRLNKQYRELIQKADSKQDLKSYVRERLHSAMWVMKAVRQRTQTLRKITEYVVSVQEAYLEHGAGYLVPLTFKQVADHVEMHETTISRAVDGKYAETPQGTIRLRD
ncbi:MAG: RNA polymerase factor sigma-54, partial [Candidatus Omnitrophica bacterium]|nr:RNA polymerase factor sigma-54 [Candidatus Omnitrophota bacterium]